MYDPYAENATLIGRVIIRYVKTPRGRNRRSFMEQERNKDAVRPIRPLSPLPYLLFGLNFYLGAMMTVSTGIFLDKNIIPSTNDSLIVVHILVNSFQILIVPAPDLVTLDQGWMFGGSGSDAGLGIDGSVAINELKYRNQENMNNVHCTPPI
ncbi:hypothetical protein K435DRAFT_801298 [Dendrothele bispora CBS 962.96]|uniref:Uncharacterized protein n=1 Tax=Dendrothele bispora (strain CBS 962.96) TaxID=1314807 RepID=A0A4S8LQB9_DENBC|nr:hypothetical protein K435DRAFT_801298 [Dendrothele bispora CBS 962.96]